MSRKHLRLRNVLSLIICTILLLLPFNETASADTVSVTTPSQHSPFQLQRLAGSDRYETSALICQQGWTNKSDYIVITTGENFPDSLCAAPLAAKLKAPILLTNTTCLNQYSKNEILRLKPKTIYIIGGQGVVSETVENEIKDMNINTIRIAGNDRYQTSVMVAKLLGTTYTVFLVTGENFPDALSIASIAAKAGAPILLSDKDIISTELKDYLNSISINQSYIIGGQAIISNNIFNQLPNCTRIFGNNRYETNISVLDNFSSELNLANSFITTGQDFPDALSCASLAGLDAAPIILASTNKEAVTSDYFKSINSFVKNVTVIGGESIVPNNVIDLSPQDANAKNTLKIPTYDGSGQACHPKVLYFANRWNGWKYWMAMTPYPDGNDFLENPSIVVSNSGTNWKVPKGIKNPITPLPDAYGKHNSDPHLVFNEKNNQLELWYRYTIFDKEDRIIKMSSSDGVHWTQPQVMLSYHNDQRCYSPAIIIENNTYKMWYINQDFSCMYIESTDNGLHWTTPLEINMNLTDTYVPWHIDVVHTDLGYETVFSGAKRADLIFNLNNRILFSNVSTDGINFGTSRIILTSPNNDKAWDNKQIYRSTFVKVGDVYKLFYSAMDKKNKWHIGLTQGYSLDNLHGYDGSIN